VTTRRPDIHLPRMTLRRAMLVSAVVGLLFAISSIASISPLPPKVTSRHDSVAAAATALMIDGPSPAALDRTLIYREFPGYINRAMLFSNLITSEPVLNLIGRQVGIRGDQIYAVARLTSPVSAVMREPDAEQRANQLLRRGARYRLDLQADPYLPIVTIYAQAPTVAEAEQLADASISSLEQYLHQQAVAAPQRAGTPFVLHQLGRARGAVVNHKIPPQLFVLTFLVAFSLSLALLMGAAQVRRSWIAAGPNAPPAAAAPVRRRWLRRPRADGNWPHTTRVLPWMIAGFMVLLWLVPFNTIQLNASLPFDLKLDRLLLPILFGTWLLSASTGGPAAPRLRLTPIHIGVGLVVGTAALSIVTNAQELNQALEFDGPIKKLVLLLSFALLFLIVASSIRPGEVPAFMKFMLGLGLIAALGTIWEYRFFYNVFYDIPQRVLPGFFSVGIVDSHEVDEIGRRMTRGPAEHPLECVAMLSMAFPIALVGIINSKTRGKRALYAIAAVLLLAAAMSTYRKTALLAPVSIILTVAWFRRRDLLKLAPLGLLSLIAIHFVSPGALGSVFVQLKPNSLNAVSTVSDRSSDYDAIRPDVWSHLLFGRGYGSYDHITYRVLDSEVLSRLVDVGVLGLASLFLLVALIVASARGYIHGRHPAYGGPALAVAAAAVGFIVLAFLFDVTSFPHTPYLLLTMAGMLAAIVGAEDREQPAGNPPDRALRRPDDGPPEPDPGLGDLDAPVPAVPAAPEPRVPERTFSTV